MSEAAARMYDRLAARYDARWAAYLAVSLPRTLAAIEPTGADVLLDVGCGTGQLLRLARQRWPALRVYGLDPSREMLRLVTVGGRVQGLGQQLPVRDASVGWLVSTSAFHYLHDPHRALLEWRRVLRPAGSLVITDWCADYASIRLLHAWKRLTSAVERRVYRADGLRALLAEAGFERVTIVQYRVDWFWGLMTARASKPQRDL